MAEEKERPAPIRQSVRVDCPIDEAFELFTERMTEWWPLESHSTAGQEAEECAFEPRVGGRVFERTQAGEEREWGRILVWEPPRRIEFTWHPGSRDEDGQTVELEFCTEANGTRVTLTHRGWHLAGAQALASSGQYAMPWSSILEACFAEFVAREILVYA